MEKKRKKILHVVEALGTGGLERIVATTVLGLDRERFDPRVWCLARGGEIAEELREQGIPVEIVGICPRHRLAGVIALARKLKRAGAHVVHTHDYVAGTLARPAAVFSGVPVLIHHVHSTYHEYRPRHRRIERLLSCVTCRVVCVSEAVRGFVTEGEGIRSEKTDVVPNGSPGPLQEDLQIDTAMERRQLGIGAEDRVIITVASLTPNKGHETLLEAVAPIMEKDPKVRLLIVGDGPLREALTQQSQALGIASRVQWAGLRSDIFRILRLSDLFVLPSLYREGLSLAVIEAMAAGLPVVCTNLDGMSELVDHGESGLLVPAGDAAGLSRALLMLLNGDDLAKRVGCSGRARYERHFTSDLMIRRIEGLYDQCLENQRTVQAGIRAPEQKR